MSNLIIGARPCQNEHSRVGATTRAFKSRYCLDRFIYIYIIYRNIIYIYIYIYKVLYICF